MLKKRLTHFSLVLHFFSGGIDMQHWAEMGLLDEWPLHNFLRVLVHGIGAKLLSTWEWNMLYTKIWQMFCRKRIFILPGLTLSSLACKCVFYRPEHNETGAGGELWSLRCQKWLIFYTSCRWQQEISHNLDKIFMHLKDLI